MLVWEKNHLDPDSLSFFISAQSETWKRETPLIEQLGEGLAGHWTWTGNDREKGRKGEAREKIWQLK